MKSPKNILSRGFVNVIIMVVCRIKIPSLEGLGMGFRIKCIFLKLQSIPIRLIIYLLLASSSSDILAQVSAVYAGGPVYIRRDYSINELKESGFNTVIVWTIHIEDNGDMGFNAEFPLIKNGVYIGDELYPNFKDDMADLKSESSSINRLEFGLSAAGSGTYGNIKALVESEGTGPESTLYKNFKALRDAIPEVDALNNDDESTYDVASSVAFHVMLYDLGFKTALVPYQAATAYWKPLTEQVNQLRDGAIDRLYLQVYAGGAGNDPCSNIWDYGIPVYPGVWGGGNRDTPTEVFSKMRNWKEACDIDGGFMWLYDDFDDSPQVKEFASAITNAMDLSITSITEANSSAQLYPNPTTSEVRINLPKDNGNVMELVVYNLTGNEIYRADQSSFFRSNGYMSWLPEQNGAKVSPGLYMIKAYLDSQVFNFKVRVNE